METKICEKNDDCFEECLKECATFIEQGKLVVFPTETVYGLGANALDPDAVQAIFTAKGRPSDNPLIVHICDKEMLEVVTDSVPEKAKMLMDIFWPGPLTIIMKKSDLIPDAVSCGLPTVGIRMPSNPIALELIKRSGAPVAAPSANISGRPSPTRAEHVIEDLKGKVDAIIDGGDCEVGLESTIIDVSGERPVLLRPGGITKEQLTKVLGKIEIADPNAEKPLAPGMKYRHYAPDTKLILSGGDTPERQREKMRLKCLELQKEGKKFVAVGSIELYNEFKPTYEFRIVGTRRNRTILAANMFKVLRDLDKGGYDNIVMCSCPERGIGLAIMNRLRKAATEII